MRLSTSCSQLKDEKLYVKRNNIIDLIIITLTLIIGLSPVTFDSRINNLSEQVSAINSNLDLANSEMHKANFHSVAGILQQGQLLLFQRLDIDGWSYKNHNNFRLQEHRSELGYVITAYNNLSTSENEVRDTTGINSIIKHSEIEKRIQVVRKEYHEKAKEVLSQRNQLNKEIISIEWWRSFMLSTFSAIILALSVMRLKPQDPQSSSLEQPKAQTTQQTDLHHP